MKARSFQSPRSARAAATGAASAANAGFLKMASATLVVAGGLFAAHTAHADPLPAERHQGAVAYVSGGVTQEAAAAFREAGRSYSLVIEMAERIGGHNAFAADAQVRITGANGTPVLDVKADGPYLLVRLPAGQYKVQASLKGRTVESKPIDVKAKGSQHTTLVFPEGSG